MVFEAPLAMVLWALVGEAQESHASCVQKTTQLAEMRPMGDSVSLHWVIVSLACLSGIAPQEGRRVSLAIYCPVGPGATQLDTNLHKMGKPRAVPP